MITKVNIHVDQDDQKELDRDDRSVLIAIDQVRYLVKVMSTKVYSHVD